MIVPFPELGLGVGLMRQDRVRFRVGPKVGMGECKPTNQDWSEHCIPLVPNRGSCTAHCWSPQFTSWTSSSCCFGHQLREWTLVHKWNGWNTKLGNTERNFIPPDNTAHPDGWPCGVSTHGWTAVHSSILSIDELGLQVSDQAAKTKLLSSG